MPVWILACVCVCVCVCVWELVAQIQSNLCVSSLSTVFISFYFWSFCPHPSFSHLSLASLASWLLLPLWMRDPTLYQNVQRSPESVVSCQFALPLGWTHSPLHTQCFSSSIYHMAMKFPLIFLSSSASLMSSSNVQTWSSSCLAQSKQSFNKDWLTLMLNEQNKIKNLNKEYTNRLRLIPFITFPVQLRCYLASSLSQSIV